MLTHLGKLQGDSGAKETFAVKLIDGVISIPGIIKLSKAVLPLLDQHVTNPAVFIEELLDVAHFTVGWEIAQENPGISSSRH